MFLPVLLSVAGPSHRRSSDTEKQKNSPTKEVAMLEVTKKLNGDNILNGDSVQQSEREGQDESEVKERLLENGEGVA